jgi:Uma2 family endonuclease
MPLPKLNHYTLEDIYALPEGHHAELIDGQLYDMAPPSTSHQRILSFLHLEIGNYIRNRNGSCEVFPAPFAVFLNEDKENDSCNYLEPDISVVCDPKKINEKGCSGAPDWIIEIVSPGSKRMDYYTKLSLYRANGVREYWIVDPMKKTVVVYDMEHDDGPVLRSLGDKIKVNIYDNLEIDFSKLHI